MADLRPLLVPSMMAGEGPGAPELMCLQVSGPGDSLAPPVFREGKNQYLKAFGVPSEELFSAIYR